MASDSLKDTLKAGKAALGPFVNLNSGAMIEIAAIAGFDFVIIDTEHGPLDIPAAEDLCRTAKGAGITPIVRIRENDAAQILRALDIGAAGVQVPQIGTKSDAEAVVQAAKYVPLGMRGVSPYTRAARYFADGAAIFRVPGGYIYACNSEVANSSGGVSAIVFDYRGRTVDAYSICSGTSKNCAGGAMPWGTWLTCEETSDGQVFECDPTGVSAAVVRPALGTFKHEAVCADIAERRLYLTEDQADGNFYRFTPTVWGQLNSGLLEVAKVSSGAVTWAR